MSFFDDLETRSADQRANDLALALPAQIANAQKLSGYSNALDGVDASAIQTIDDVAQLPVLRKSDLVQAQSENGPLGGYGALNTHEFAHIFQSPGPIYEPGGVVHDWWAHRAVFECRWYWCRGHCSKLLWVSFDACGNDF